MWICDVGHQGSLWKFVITPLIRKLGRAPMSSRGLGAGAESISLPVRRYDVPVDECQTLSKSRGKLTSREVSVSVTFEQEGPRSVKWNWFLYCIAYQSISYENVKCGSHRLYTFFQTYLIMDSLNICVCGGEVSCQTLVCNGTQFGESCFNRNETENKLC